MNPSVAEITWTCDLRRHTNWQHNGFWIAFFVCHMLTFCAGFHVLYGENTSLSRDINIGFVANIYLWLKHFCKYKLTWWRHQMETFSALLVFCGGNSPVTGEFPAQKPVMRSFDVFFDLSPNKGWTNHRDAGDLRRHRAHYDAIVLKIDLRKYQQWYWKIVLLENVSNIRGICWRIISIDLLCVL